MDIREFKVNKMVEVEETEFTITLSPVQLEMLAALVININGAALGSPVASEWYDIRRKFTDAKVPKTFSVSTDVYRSCFIVQKEGKY